MTARRSFHIRMWTVVGACLGLGWAALGMWFGPIADFPTSVVVAAGYLTYGAVYGAALFFLGSLAVKLYAKRR